MISKKAHTLAVRYRALARHRWDMGKHRAKGQAMHVVCVSVCFEKVKCGNQKLIEAYGKSDVNTCALEVRTYSYKAPTLQSTSAKALGSAP